MFLLFILSPFFITLLYGFILLHYKTVKKEQLWLLAIMLSLYLGLLNSTKEILGDFGAYYMDYMNIAKYDFISYIYTFGKEPIYTSFAYISYQIFNGNWKIYVILLTSINYLLISYCIIKVSEYLKTNHKNTITVLFIMTFFFQEFASIGNIMRQGPAQALVMVFFTILYLDNRKAWWIALCALFTHTSTLPIIAIGIIPSLRYRFTIKSITYAFTILLFTVFLFFSLESTLSNVPFIGYIYQRTNNTEALLGTDSWQIQLGFNFFTGSIVILLCIISLYLYYKNRGKKEFPAVGVININIILLLMLIISDTIEAYYLFLRYFFYIYTFQNLLILYYLHQINIKDKYIHAIIILLTIVYFFYCFTHNIFKYISIDEALFYPIPFYF